MKVFAGRSECLGKGALKSKAKRRRGLPVVRGLAACALGIAVAAMLGAASLPLACAAAAGADPAGTQIESIEAAGTGGAPSDAVPDDPTALPVVSADDGQLTVNVPTQVPCVMLGDGSIIGPATWSIQNGSGKAARLANVHAERKAQSVKASATARDGTSPLDVSPASATFNQGFTLDSGSSADFGWSAAVTDDIERSEALSGALLGPTSLLTLTFTFAEVEDEPQPSAASAFAVFSADDDSLTLYKRADAPVEGTAFLGKEATRVYTGIENSRSTQPWNDVADRIASVSVADAGVAPKSLYAWFFGCTSLTNVDLRGLDASGTTSMAFMFSHTSSCTDFSDVFQDATSLKEIDMTGWDTSKGTTFAQMLFNCKSLEHVDLSPPRHVKRRVVQADALRVLVARRARPLGYLDCQRDERLRDVLGDVVAQDREARLGVLVGRRRVPAAAERGGRAGHRRQVALAFEREGVPARERALRRGGLLLRPAARYGGGRGDRGA